MRYALTAGSALRATGHTASDQVETVLYRIVSSAPRAGSARREDGVVRPLLPLWREKETEEYCGVHGLAWRVDTSMQGPTWPDPRAHPAAPRGARPARAGNLPRPQRTTTSPAPAREATLVALLASGPGPRTADLGGGIRAVRSYDVLRLDGAVTWGPWRISSDRPRLVVRSRRPGDRLAGRAHGVRDVLVDAKVTVRSATWPLVATEDGAVVAVAGLAEAPGWEGAGDRRAGGRDVRPRLRRRRGADRREALRSHRVVSSARRSRRTTRRDLLLVGVLKGAIFFISDLMRELTVPCEVDFMAISSYGTSTDSSGVVRILKDLEINITGRDVYIVEVIIDSGLTLHLPAARAPGARKPASLEICALLTKPERREVESPVTYVGPDPEPVLIGYGLDFAERYRNLPYIGVLHPDLVPGGHQSRKKPFPIR